MASQHDVSKMIVEYLCKRFKANMYNSGEKLPPNTGYTVRYSHKQIRDTTKNWPRAETISLYIGGKNKGRGRDEKIAIPDVALIEEDDKKVKLLVEVESGTNFKKLLRSIGPIAMADVYTPSHKYNPNAKRPPTNYSSDGNDYSIEKIILCILVLDVEREQYKKMSERPMRVSNTDKTKEITIFFDYNSNPQILFTNFINKLESIEGFKPDEMP